MNLKSDTAYHYSLLLVSAIFLNAHAQATVATNDAGTQAAIQSSNAQQLSKWTEQIGKMNDQLTEAKKYVELTGKMKDAIGDPAQAAGIIDAGLLGGELGNAGVGKLLSELSETGSNVQNLSEGSQKLFTPVDFQNPLDSSGFSSHDPYKKFEAFRSTYGNFERVSEDTQNRRAALKQEASRLQDSLKTAATDAEVQKIQGQIAVNQAAMSALNQEQSQAADQVAAAAAANDQDKALATKQEADAINAEEAETISNISFQDSTPKGFIPVGGIRR